MTVKPGPWPGLRPCSRRAAGGTPGPQPPSRRHRFCRLTAGGTLVPQPPSRRLPSDRAGAGTAVTAPLVAALRSSGWWLVLLLALLPGLAAAASIKISCGAVGQELEMCRQSAEDWARRTGHEVQVVATPTDSNDRLALYQQVLASHSDTIDVFQIDIVWPGLLAEHLHDLRDAAGDVTRRHFPALIENNTVAGRLIAMPWFSDAGLLYYRRDLLEKHGRRVPQTWDELAETAQAIQDAERRAGNLRLWGYVWQGRGYEGLTCNALEWFASHLAGHIVEADGRISVAGDAAAAALRRAAGWIGRITPQATLNHGEEEARGIFQAGNAVFMRNWPFVWSLAQAPDSPVQGQVGIAVLPRGPGGRPAATLGGQQLAVSRYSRHTALAADLVLHMTSAAVQRERAIRGSFNPTLTSLYEDADVLAANPFMRELSAVFANAVSRPASVTGARYNEMSQAVWTEVHAALEGRREPDEALARLAAELDRQRAGGGWRPGGRP